MQGSAYRLPRTVVPSRYDVWLRLDPAASDFSGTVDVAVTVHETVNEITLNAKDLAISGCEVRSSDGSRIAAPTVSADADTERSTVTLGAPLEPGEHVLHLAFSGSFGGHLAGLYRSSYRDDDGGEHFLISTHFEATDARRAFPCWDEPDMKASFALTLDVPDGLTALTNTPEVGREPSDAGMTRIRFAESMRMSTYLVAVVVGGLGLTAPSDARGVPVRTVCRPDRVPLAGYATEVGVFALDWFADYYGIPYPEQKLDQVAVPDFAQGAMENTGLVTYRETLLLIDTATAAPEERLNVAETIAHELAHMWFGDLVTMRWWNGLWLNEAFATFMSYLCVDALEPDWRVFDTFQADRMRAFEVDSLATTRPIEFPVESPADASGMFDVLTYTKGGAVLRMIEQWLGPDLFRDGVRRYLTAHAHGNTETHDLWDALEAESGQPVRRIMEPWIFQPGYPAIYVRRDGNVIHLAQRRFAPSLPDDTTTWLVPLIVRQLLPDGELVERVIVEGGGLDLTLAHPDAVVVANADSASFVRTFYDDDLRSRLMDRIAVDLTPGERLSLVDDAWAAVVAGDADVTSFLDLVAGFAGETSPPVWLAILSGLRWCDRFVDGDTRERFRASVRDLLRPGLQRLGWDGREGESDLERELRGDLIRAMGILGNDPETQALAREDEARARAGHGIDPAVASAAIDVAAFAGGPFEYDVFVERMNGALTPHDQDRYRYALPLFREPDLMQRTLDLVASDGVRTQDAPFLLQVALMNRDLGEMTWRFVRDHWDELVSRYADPNVVALAQGARWLTAPAAVADVQAFFADHDIPQSHRTLVQAMERQRLYAALRERAAPDLAVRFGS